MSRAHEAQQPRYSFVSTKDICSVTYGVAEGQLLQGLPELLRGDALHWYRNVASPCTSWADFEEKPRGFYLPPLERRQLSCQVAEWTQRL